MNGVINRAAVIHQYGSATISGGAELACPHSGGADVQYNEHKKDNNGRIKIKKRFALNEMII